MPVIIELEEKLLRERLGDDHYEIFTERALAERIQHGLRASLQTESLVTGVLYVDIRLNPNAPPPVFHQLEKIYPEMPTEPTQIQQLMSNLASLDIKSIETNLNALLTKLDTTVGESADGRHQSRPHQPLGLRGSARFRPGHYQRPGRRADRPWTNTASWARSSTAAWIRWPTASPTRSRKPIAPWPRSAAPAKTCGPCSRPTRRCATTSTRPCNNSPAPRSPLSALARLPEATPQRPHHRSRNPKKKP